MQKNDKAVFPLHSQPSFFLLFTYFEEKFKSCKKGNKTILLDLNELFRHKNMNEDKLERLFLSVAKTTYCKRIL